MIREQSFLCQHKPTNRNCFCSEWITKPIGHNISMSFIVPQIHNLLIRQHRLHQILDQPTANQQLINLSIILLDKILNSTKSIFCLQLITQHQVYFLHILLNVQVQKLVLFFYDVDIIVDIVAVFQDSKDVGYACDGSKSGE